MNFGLHEACTKFLNSAGNNVESSYINDKYIANNKELALLSRIRDACQLLQNRNKEFCNLKP
jgi:hypothetical protein